MKTLVQLGTDHDKRVKEWRDDLAKDIHVDDDVSESDVNFFDFPVLYHNPFDIVIDDSHTEDDEDGSNHQNMSSVTSTDAKTMSADKCDLNDNSEGSPVPPTFSEIVSSKSDEDVEIEKEEIYGIHIFTTV
jgi:hypothetical protein